MIQSSGHGKSGFPSKMARSASSPHFSVRWKLFTAARVLDMLFGAVLRVPCPCLRSVSDLNSISFCFPRVVALFIAPRRAWTLICVHLSTVARFFLISSGFASLSLDTPKAVRIPFLISFAEKEPEQEKKN